jgi:transcriptional regulator with XRE-family HTH domain
MHYNAFMKAYVSTPPQELQIALGEQIRRLRLSRNLDQRTTAEKAGISLRALGNLEGGRGSTVETLLRTLKALDYLEGIEALAPEITVDPLALLDSPKPQRRVRRKRSPEKGAR